MTKVALQFFGKNEVQLGEVLFCHPLLEHPVLAVRGRSQGAHRGCASFPWGSVAKGFSLLMLRAKAFGTVNAMIEGDAASLASSLDYAISKPPVWFQDLFGFDRFGVTLARRVFDRTNPERKRPGPVRIAINAHQLEPENILVSWNGVSLTEPKDVRLLLERFETSIERAIEVKELIPPVVDTEKAGAGPAEFDYAKGMTRQYIAEVLRSLRRPEVFTRNR